MPQRRLPDGSPAPIATGASHDAGYGSAEPPALRLSSNAILQVVMVWRGQIIGYRLLRRPGRVTIGPNKRATLVAPPVAGHGSRFLLVRPQRGGYRLRLAPGMSGELAFAGKSGQTAVADVLAKPLDVPGRRRKTDYREVTMEPGDRAWVVMGDARDLRLEIRFVDPPDVVGKPRGQEPLLTQTMVGSSLVMGIVAVLLSMFWGLDGPRPPLAISEKRLAKLQAPLERHRQDVAKRAEAEKEEEEKQESKKEEGQTKRAKEKSGKLGRQDAVVKDTVIPKGEKDVLRAKVSKVGLLGLIGKEKQGGSGLSKLFADSNDVEQAVAGMTGAKMVAGRGSGGLATSGSGAGGGGTGFGQIYGAGNLDTGGRGSKGKGRGPKLVDRGEREVKVSMSTGNGETDGSLSREQIEKVVRAHAAGIKYCYEKELQRKPSLSGNVDIFWVILPDGTVQKANVKTSTMKDAAVEGCIVRQVKQWQFPKAPGQTIVGRFPFLFKGGL